MVYKKTEYGNCERCQDKSDFLGFSFYPYNRICGKCYREIIDYINGIDRKEKHLAVAK